jgi:thiamine-phosphate diphosphorylase/hydroxyethylthiazole kinase
LTGEEKKTTCDDNDSQNPDLAAARGLLGQDAIIGVTANSAEEAIAAAAGGADYLGIGTVYATSTKKDTKAIIGTQGVQTILEALRSAGHPTIRTVCIGGIKTDNAARVLHESGTGEKQLDGLAVVSALMAAEQPETEARTLRALVAAASSASSSRRQQPTAAIAAAIAAATTTTTTTAIVTAGSMGTGTSDEPTNDDDDHDHDVANLLQAVPAMTRAVHDATPLSHNMTNLVVQNLAANVALAVGASPIMANYGEEAEDLARLGGALVVNMGTVTPDGLANYAKALRAYNKAGGPVVFDPVG